MDNNIPQWVIDYNNAGHQSSAGRAINILMSELTRLRSELQQKDEEINLREAQQDVMAADTVKLLDQIEFQNKTAKEDHDKIKKLEFELAQEREKVERAFLAGRSKTSWKQFHKDEKTKL